MISNMVILWAFLIGFLIYLVVNTFVAYHIVRFAYLNAPTRVMMIVNVLVTLAVIVLVVVYGLSVDWNAGIEINNPLSNPAVTDLGL